ncbi:MAG: hypothetical protein ACJARR_000785 [Pseudophaeobacter arcticus]|jgi:hypothetical protein
MILRPAVLGFQSAALSHLCAETVFSFRIRPPHIRGFLLDNPLPHRGMWSGYSCPHAQKLWVKRSSEMGAKE